LAVAGRDRHAEQAAGFFSFIKAVEMARHRTFLPTGGLREARTDVDWVVSTPHTRRRQCTGR
jgi:acyl transferase domain-containing protein